MSFARQDATCGHIGGDPVIPFGEDSGLGSDPFNLIPIIEYHQRARKRRLRRHVERLALNIPRLMHRNLWVHRLMFLGSLGFEKIRM